MMPLLLSMIVTSIFTVETPQSQPSVKTIPQESIPQESISPVRIPQQSSQETIVPEPQVKTLKKQDPRQFGPRYCPPCGRG